MRKKVGLLIRNENFLKNTLIFIAKYLSQTKFKSSKIANKCKNLNIISKVLRNKGNILTSTSF